MVLTAESPSLPAAVRHGAITALGSQFTAGADLNVAVDGGMSDNLRPMLYEARYEAMIDGKPVKLTPKEFELLGYLLRNEGRVLTRPKISVAIIGPEVIRVGEKVPFQIKLSNTGSGAAQQVRGLAAGQRTGMGFQARADLQRAAWCTGDDRCVSGLKKSTTVHGAAW